MKKLPPTAFLERILSPNERLGSTLFGLIMTLTFTLGAEWLLRDEPFDRGRFLAAVVGCNLAWGVIDGAFLIVGRSLDRSRPARLGHALRALEPGREAVEVIAEEFDGLLGPLVDEGPRRTLYESIAKRAYEARPNPLEVPRADWVAAAADFWLVFFSSVPVALPFAFIADPWIAMRASNALLLALLFYVSYRWACFTSERPWHTASLVTSGGVALVVAAILLGG